MRDTTIAVLRLLKESMETYEPYSYVDVYEGYGFTLDLVMGTRKVYIQDDGSVTVEETGEKQFFVTPQEAKIATIVSDMLFDWKQLQRIIRFIKKMKKSRDRRHFYGFEYKKDYFSGEQYKFITKKERDTWVKENPDYREAITSRDAALKPYGGRS